MAAGYKSLFSWIAALAMAVLAFAAGPAHAQDAELANAIKATFLVRFGSFATWPPHAFESAGAPFTICVSGPQAFADLVEDAAAGERIANRPVAVRRIDAVSPALGCHVAFLGGVAGQSVHAGLSALRGTPTLTVTDEAYGPARGAVHFTLAANRVRFHIDRGAAESNQLNLSSRLLAIAISVRRRGGAGR